MNHRVMPKTDTLPHALYRAQQVRELDRQVIERFGITGATLMQRAGEAAFALACERWPQARRVVVLAGPGNNGGDGFVFALAACAAGCDVVVLQLGERESIRGDARAFAERWLEQGGEWQDYRGIPRQADLIVDAMLGTGLQRELRGDFALAVEAANAHPAPKLAIDIPSGLHSDRGTVLGTAIRADATLSFIGLKQGMFTADGVERCGEIFFDALEAPAAVYASQVLAARRIDWGKQSALLGPRARAAHKGHFGHVLVIGGDHGFGGAARLAAEAAARCGAGLVSVATRAAHVAGLLAARPELMVHAVDHSHALEPLLARADVLVLGPGLGTTAWGRELFAIAMQSGRPMVLDADGLNLLAEPDPETDRRDNWVLTPHPGEAGRLLQVCTAEINGDRFAAAEALQRRFGGCVVLKGAGTLVNAGGSRPPAVCSAGNPGMASGGMGDVLGGVIAALMAQGLAPAEAAEAGVCLHAAAADQLVAEQGERGMLAADLMPRLQRLVNP